MRRGQPRPGEGSAEIASVNLFLISSFDDNVLQNEAGMTMMANTVFTPAP